jgi:hypothetical protein
VVDNEPRHMAQAPWSRFRRAGSGARAKDQQVHGQVLGGADDFLLRPSSRDQGGNSRPGQSVGESPAPDGEKSGRPQIVRLGEALLYRNTGVRRPRSPAEWQTVSRQLARTALLDVQQSELDRRASGANNASHLGHEGRILRAREGHQNVSRCRHLLISVSPGNSQ